MPDMFVRCDATMGFAALVDELWRRCQPRLDAGDSPCVWLELFALDLAGHTALDLHGGVSQAANAHADVSSTPLDSGQLDMASRLDAAARPAGGVLDLRTGLEHDKVDP